MRLTSRFLLARWVYERAAANRFADGAVAPSSVDRILSGVSGTAELCQWAVRRGRAGLRLGEQHDVVWERSDLPPRCLAESRIAGRDAAAGCGERHRADDQ